MHFEPDAVYHVYNRSNEQVFFSRENYLYFLKKVQLQIKPACNILSWVLMPNHFHFLIQATPDGCRTDTESHLPHIQLLSKRFGNILSSYTQAINKERNRRGKLFSHNTKAKNLNDIAFEEALSGSNRLAHRPDYTTACFLYIHQNPVIAGIANSLSDWEFSSFRDYTGRRKGKLVNKEIAKELIELDFENFEQQSQFLIEEELMKKLF